MNNTILIAGGATQRGAKIGRFLRNKGYNVFGVDRTHTDKPVFARFFRMDMRHPESIALVMSIVKPTILIFCPEKVVQRDYSYPAYTTVLDTAGKAGVKKVILCLDTIVEKPKTFDEISQLALYQTTNVLQDEYKFESLIITEKDNLLREIKEFVGKGEEK